MEIKTQDSEIYNQTLPNNWLVFIIAFEVTEIEGKGKILSTMNIEKNGLKPHWAVQNFPCFK